MQILNDLLQELGISKVRLAKYLGVSRQMIYNYLELPSLSKWPKDKKIALLKLLDIEDGELDTLKNIKVSTDYILEVEERLLKDFKETMSTEYLDLKGLKKEEQQLVGDITFLIKDKLVDNPRHEENYYLLLYINHLLQTIDNNPEIKYLLAYVSKANGLTKPNVFHFNEDEQFAFEGIIHSALTLFKSGEASPKKVLESHNRFVKEIEERNEEILSRTQQLLSLQQQALKELGYSEVTLANASEFYEKFAEIESRNSR